MNNKTEEQSFSLEKFSPLIAELESKASMYMSLSINGINDKENQVVVQKAKMEVVRLRTSIEKFAKEIRDPHTQFNKLVSEKEKELIAKIEPVEKHLKAEQEKVEQELKRIEEEEKEKAKKIFEERIKNLSEIKCIPDNLFAIGSMNDMEFELYYKDKIEEYNLKQKEETSINLINSSDTLEDLEELQHNDLFYWTDNIKEIFEKRFNEITEEIEKINKQMVLSTIIQINNCDTLEELKEIPGPTNPSDELIIAYNNRKQFLEQQEELNKIKAEQEEKRKQEEQEKLKQLHELEKKKALYKAEVFSCNTQDELIKLFSETKYGNLFDYIKPFFTERKNYILEQERIQQQQKEFQDYLQSINYNKEDCIIQKNSQGETLIYKLIGKWNK